MGLLERLQSAEGWPEARDKLFEIWRADVDLPAIDEAIAVMGAQSGEMWMRSGRVIESSYRRHGAPLAARRRKTPKGKFCIGKSEPATFADSTQLCTLES